MNTTHDLQQLLSEAGIQFEEVFADRDCPICGRAHQLAA